MQREEGAQLFIRGRHLALTDAGVMLRRRAEEMVSLMDKTLNEFENYGEVGGVISIGSERLVFRPPYPELSMTSVLVWKKFQPNVK